MPFDDEPCLSFFLFPELCKDLQWKIDTDVEVKVAKNENEVLVFVMEMNRSLTLCQNFLWKLSAVVLYLG